jgi:predicted peroxiredoxin
MRNATTGLAGIVVVAALAFFVGSLQRPALATQSGDKPTVLFNITSGKEDLHSVTMALQLAGHALSDGRDVVLFFNVRAPEFARADLPETFAFSDNPPIKKMIAELIARGAQPLVCPHCAGAMGVKESDFAPGMKLASRESLFGKLGPNAVVFTY